MAALKNEKLIFQELTQEEKQRRGILGRLYGPCADVIHETRNGRKYSQKLWEKVFSDPLVLEMIEKGGIPGELDHPADRQEICSEKIAIIMPEIPKKNDKGELIAYFDILDTPNGRIAHTLAKYGFQLGVSSRGSGDVYEDYDGKESVDPETYTFNCFDLVLCPSVKTARLTLQESLGKKTFKEAINESLNQATADEKRIMIESLQKLKIDYKMQSAMSSASSNTKLTESKTPKQIATADDAGDKALVEELQKQIKLNKELTESLASVQEKLSVCYAKEAKYEAKLEQSLQTAEQVKDLNDQIVSLQEKLEQKDTTLRNMRKRLSSLSESSSNAESDNKQLTESLNSKDKKISLLEESLAEEKQNSKLVTESLNTQIEALKKDKAIKANEFTQKLQKAKGLVEHYKKLANEAVDRYISSKARMLGVSPEQIKSRLNENYTFDDVDMIYENLQNYQVTMSKLPFNAANNKNVKVKVTESVEPIRPRSIFDDEVDDSLLRLGGLD